MQEGEKSGTEFRRETAAAASSSATSHDPARRRIIRELGVLVPLVVPSIMGAVVMLWLR